MKARLLLMGALCWGAIWLVGCRGEGHWEERVRVRGYQGEADRDPFLAAKLFLKEYGVGSRNSYLFPEDLASHGAIMASANSLKTRGDAEDILEFAEYGGLAVITMAGSDLNRDDFSSWSGFFDDDSIAPGFSHLLDEFGYRVGSGDFTSVDNDDAQSANDKSGENAHLRRDFHVDEFLVAGARFQVEQEGGAGLWKDTGEELDDPDSSDLPLQHLYVPRGDGGVLIMAHARPFRNPYLDRADHAKLIRFLAKDLSQERGFLIVTGGGDTFWDLLWRAGWPAIVAGFVLLGLWLWWKLPRFGPAQAERAHDARDKRQEFTLLGRFFWQTRTLSHLLKPLQQNLPKQKPDFLDVSSDHYQQARTAGQISDPGELLRSAKILKTFNDHSK